MVTKLHTIAAATATTTGGAVDVRDAKKVGFIFKRSAHSSGSTAFTVSVSPDNGTTWITYNRLIENVASTNAQTVARVASVTLSANGTVFAMLDPIDIVTHVKVTATETTDGTHDAWVITEE